MSSLGGAPSGASAAAKKRAKKKGKGPAQEEPKAENVSESTTNSNDQPAGSSLGGSSLGGSSLGGAPAGGASLGGASLGGASLGGATAASKAKNKKKKKAGAADAGSSLGGSSLGGSSLGGAPAGSSLGGVPTPTPSEEIPQDEAAANEDDDQEAAAGGDTAAKKKKQRKKKGKGAAAAAPKKSKFAELIKKQQEEEERLRQLEEERLKEEEAERLRLEAEEEEKSKKLIEAAKKRKQKAKEAQKNKKNREFQAKAARLMRTVEMQQQQPKTPETPEKSTPEKEGKEKEADKPKDTKPVEEEEDDWEKLANDDDEVDEKPEEKETPSTTEVKNELRSPICCVLGHVDTGKTSLLDMIRKTKVQKGEAGGITQQIGATFFPQAAIKEKTASLASKFKDGLNIPGLLIIDTPGHESFTNMRSRGTSLCDIAILVIDCNHGMEPQTIESIKLLKLRKTPFVVAMNKIDRIYGWQANNDHSFEATLEKQTPQVRNGFEEKLTETKVCLAEEGLNAELYTRNTDVRKTVSIVPTSAITGEGIPDLIMLIVQLTQTLMAKRLYLSDELKCTVLEVKVTEGFGYTVDAILIDGKLRKNDQIVLCGMSGPIVTRIKAILTPHPLKEIRVKTNKYERHKEIRAAMGVKLVATDPKDFQNALAGTDLLVSGPDDDLEEIEEAVQKELKGIKSLVGKTTTGVYVQASSLGSLEALLQFLKTAKIPVAQFGIGTVYRKDVMQAAVMVDRDQRYAVMLAFDVKIDPLAQQTADELGLRIFTAPIIYHLENMFMKYLDDLEEEKRKQYASEAIWPCVLKMPSAEFAYNKRNPLVLGVEVIYGEVRIGTPICVPSKEMIVLGKVVSIEENHKQQQKAGEGTRVAIKIEQEMGGQFYMYDRHFTWEDELWSKITKHSINRLKEFFGKELTKRDIKLLLTMKKVYGID